MRHGLAKVLAALAVMLFPALAVTPAQAAEVPPDAAACTVNGAVAIAPGVNVVPQYQNFIFNTIAINCVGAGDEAGAWNVSAAGGSILPENCAAGVGEGNFTGGTGPDGAVTGGHFYYARVGVVVVAVGAITTNGDPVFAPGWSNHAFATVLVFWPGTLPPPNLPNQTCGVKPSTVTAAQLTGAATVVDADVPPLPTLGRLVGCPPLPAEMCKTA
jgi:hypothetical protein